MKNQACFILVFLLVPLACGAFLHAEEDPEIWIGHYNPERLALPDRNWDRAKKEIDVVEFYINMIAFSVPGERLKPICEDLRRHDIDVAVSCGYFDWESALDDFSAPNPKPISDKVRMMMKPGVGAETARVEMRKLARLIKAAGGIDTLVLDGPIRRLLYPGADTGRMTYKGKAEGLPGVAEAVAEVVGYMTEWRKSHPKVRFIVLTNFPNWGWKGTMAYWGTGPDAMYWGDYEPVAKVVIAQSKAAGVPLDGIRVDNPYEFATGTFDLEGTPWPKPEEDPKTLQWMPRILELEKLVRESGLKFDLIVNSEYGGATSDELFAQRSLEYLDLYHSRGGRPDRYVLEGWFKYPKELGPDTKAHTLTHTALEFAKRIDALSAGAGK